MGPPQTWYYALAEPAELDGAYSWYAVAVALGDKGSENQRDTFLRELSPSQVKSAQLNAGKIFNKIKDNRR